MRLPGVSRPKQAAPPVVTGDGAAPAVAAPASRPRHPRLRRLAKGVGVLLLALAALWLLRVPLLTAAGRLLVVDDAPRPADLLFVLGGDVDTRPFHAAALYRRGLAPRVALPRSEPGAAAELGLVPDLTTTAVRVLRRQGVPAEAVVVLATFPGGTTSTAQDGLELRRWLERNPGVRRVTVVTSRWHTRRARFNLRRQLKGIKVELRMSGARDPHFDETDWWRSEHGTVTVFQEYVKFAHNLFAR